MAHTDEEHSEGQLLERLLAARDIPCPVCGYNLRAIASTNCPECGAKLDLRVGSTDLKLGPWLAALFAGALPLGFFAGLFTLGVFIEVTWGSFFDPWGVFVWFAVSIVFYGAIVWIVTIRRRRFWSRPRRHQWRSVALTWLVSIFVIACLMTIAGLWL